MLPFAIDTETELITEATPCPKLVCLSYAVADQADLVPHALAAEVLNVAATTKEAHIVGHHFAYDACVLIQLQPRILPLIFELYDNNRIADTMIRESLYHIEHGTLQEDGRNRFTLAHLTQKHLGIALVKEGPESWRLRYGELRDVLIDAWPAAAHNYAVEDARSTLRVWEKQEVLKPGGYPDEMLQVRAEFGLKLMSNHGAITDEAAVDRFELALLERAIKQETTLRSCGLIKIKDGTRDAKLTRSMVALAYKKLNLEVPRTESSGRFEDGQIKYDELTLAESGDPRLLALSEYARVLKLLDTYVPIMRRGIDHPIYGNYNTLVASGRTSAYKPNWQNLPVASGARECIKARPGKVFVACDFSLAELRALAQVTYSWFGTSKMRDALIRGEDLHTALAATIMGITYTTAAKLKEAQDPVFVGTTDQPGIRSIAKSMNFGLAGGLGTATFSEYLRNNGIKKSQAECKILKSQWFEQWPEMHQYFALIALLCGEQGDHQLQQFGSNRIRGGLTFTSGANTMFQGYVADVAKAWLWRVTRACYVEARSPMFGARPEFFIHDELILECDREVGHEVATELEHLAIETMEEWMPDVPARADAHSMNYWTKKAEAVHDKHGRLIPWEEREL